MSHTTSRLVVASALVALAGCQGDAADPDALAAVAIVAPSHGDDPALDRVIDAAHGYLTTLTGIGPTRVAMRGETPAAVEGALSGDGLVLVVDAHIVAPEVVPPAVLEAAPEDAFVLRVEERGGATIVWTAGLSLLARQYGVYELLRRLGARFYHPEAEWVPSLPAEQVRPRARTPTAVKPRDAEVGLYWPDFAHRSYSFHAAHPLEHQEAFSVAEHPIDEAIRVNDWIVKNRGDLFRGAGRAMSTSESRATRAAELEAHRQLSGQRRGTGITLHNQQQGASAAIDRDSPVPVREQIETLVARRLERAPDAVDFGIHFGPTEFTVTPDEETVQWINWAGQKALELRPDLPVIINDHTSGSQPVDNYDDLGCPPLTNDAGVCDYYDLAFHTDPRLGVKVHTVMFYPLEGPAEVYNQHTFAHKLCLMQRASAEGRPLVWFPEGSWWLSFDNPIPVYLPLYIWTRGRDIQLITPLLASRGDGTLFSHRMFNSGHEWGYWQQDYAVGLWHWDVDISLEEVVSELTEPFCPLGDWPASCDASAVVVQVLLDAMEHQRDTLLVREDWRGRAGGLYTYFAGEDPADELAAVTGFEFRPVRVSFRTVAGWSAAERAHFEDSDLAALAEMRDFWKELRGRLEGVTPAVPAAARPFFDEIADGVAINELRAGQAHALYRAALAHGMGDTDAAEAALAEAAAILSDAEVVIRRREAAYRYPAEQTHGGGLTPDTAVDNGTTYPYRVHTKTHLMTYWHNRHEQLQRLLAGENGPDLDSVGLQPSFGPPGEALTVTWPDLPGLGGELTRSDGSSVSPPEDTWATPAEGGIFTISGVLRSDTTSLPVSGAVVRTEVQARSAAGSFVLREPDDPVAATVMQAIVPAFLFGVDDAAMAFAADVDGDGAVDFDAVAVAGIEGSNEGALSTTPVDFVLPVADPASGELAVEVHLLEAVFSGPATLEGQMTLSAGLRLADLVEALIALAGFDEEGAYQTLAGVLGFEPDSPPETVPVQGVLSLAP